MPASGEPGTSGRHDVICLGSLMNYSRYVNEVIVGRSAGVGELVGEGRGGGGSGRGWRWGGGWRVRGRKTSDWVG